MARVATGTTAGRFSVLLSCLRGGNCRSLLLLVLLLSLCLLCLLLLLLCLLPFAFLLR